MQSIVIKCLRLDLDEVPIVRLEKLVVINSVLHFLAAVSSNLLLSLIAIQPSYIELCDVNYAHAQVQVQNSSIDSSHMKVDGTIGKICKYLPISGQGSMHTDQIQSVVTNDPNTINTTILFKECVFHNGTISYL